MRIDNVGAASELRESRQRHLALLGALGRLRAEVDDTDVVFAPEVLGEAPDVARNERALHRARQRRAAVGTGRAEAARRCSASRS